MEIKRIKGIECVWMFLHPCRTHRITITNFCLGKHLVSEDDLLKDQRGSPAYISPDVLSGERKTDGLHVCGVVARMLFLLGEMCRVTSVLLG